MVRGCDRLSAAFRHALNEELEELGCTLRVSQDKGDETVVVLVDNNGNELGRLPDHADAVIIAAVGVIVERWRGSAVS